MLTGVSIVICCYNSAQRLPQTLSHLAAQKVPADLLWEVVMVDNASTDETSTVAQQSWTGSAPLRVVREPEPGLNHARHRGFVAARYDLISFVDDDNWVCADWVRTIAEIMTQHPEVGACGGYNQAAPETSLPWWFERYQDSYAVGPQADEAGDVTDDRGFLWGAGLTVRKSVWQGLIEQGFQILLSGRKGEGPSTSCEDYELCLAIRLAGWRLWYDPRLQLQHFIPSARLRWDYLRQLKRGFGAGSVGLDAYFNEHPQNFKLKAWLNQQWLFRVIVTQLKLLRYGRQYFLISSANSLEGDPEILEMEILLGRLSALFHYRDTYQLNQQTISQAPWKNSS
jgi:glycosyltransferase involved in cell wall biosynthesis